MSFPQPNNITGINDLLNYVQQTTNNTFIIGIIISTFTITLLFTMNKQEDIRNGIIISLFTTLIITSLFRVIMTFNDMIIYSIILALGLAIITKLF